jgi:phospholipase C
VFGKLRYCFASYIATRFEEIPRYVVGMTLFGGRVSAPLSHLGQFSPRLNCHISCSKIIRRAMPSNSAIETRADLEEKYMTGRSLRHIALLGCNLLVLSNGSADAAVRPRTATPIKHLIVIFQENVSFDHYFATYPLASNPPGEPTFTGLPSTPNSINTLQSAKLLVSNPNQTNPANGAGAVDPFRLDITQAATADQDHSYGSEEAAFDNFAMDLFPLKTGRGSKGGAGTFFTKGQVMGYYDGNTVTALWNYAQHFAMSDNSFSTTFGPSTPGAVNLISGQTNGVILPANYQLDADGTYAKGRVQRDGANGWTLVGDMDPTGDICSKGSTIRMSGKNIGDLLNARNITWGFFEGGFDLTQTDINGSAGCNRTTKSDITNVASADYVPHHQPFQYYASTANLQHVRPSSVARIGTNNDGGAHHQYDMTDFYAALKKGNLPAVSFLKASAYQDGHAGYSDPLDEQSFVVTIINTLQDTPDWNNTAVVILYDDSDGWYDHASAIVNPSAIAGLDVLNGDTCGSGKPLPGVAGKPVQGRCGYGMRQPLLVISPYAKANFVDHARTDQTSVLRFIEDNWLGRRRIGQGSFDAISGSLDAMFNWSSARNSKLKLDPSTGRPL